MPDDTLRRIRERWPDLAVVALLIAAALVLHRLGGFLGNPYWIDESWVAVSGKAPLHDLPWLTSASPLGWTAIVWALPSHGQIHRLVPWLFLLGSALAGFLLARMLRWPSRGWSLFAGATAGLSALLLTAQAYRNDLKQYTADAAVALVLLVLLAALEERWSRRRAAVLGAAVVFGMLLSHTAVLVGAAVFVGVVLLRRRRPVGALIFCGLTGLGMILMYLVADGATRNDSLSEYWAAYFPTVRGLPRYLLDRLHGLGQAFGVPWPLFIALVVLGVVVIVRCGRPATATAVVAMPIVEVLTGLAQKYPVLDQRTSHFLFVTCAAVAGIGLAGGAYALTSRLPGPTRLAPVALVVLLLAGYATFNRDVLLHPPRPGLTEDVRSQTAYVASHRRPGDVILVSAGASFGFAYYWNADRPQFHRGGIMATGWYLGYAPQQRIIVLSQPGPEHIAAGLAEAQTMAGANAVWIVRSHIPAAELTTWNEVLSGRSVASVPVGREPVLKLTPAAAPQ
jgi:hypothetical protein